MRVASVKVVAHASTYEYDNTMVWLSDKVQYTQVYWQLALLSFDS